METDLLKQKVIGCAIEVHKSLGPGLLESSYEQCLMYELAQVEIVANSQISLPIVSKGKDIDTAFRLDILIPNKLIIELKCVDKLVPIHTAQLLTYLKLAGIKAGLLFNFNVEQLLKGIKRISN